MEFNEFMNILFNFIGADFNNNQTIFFKEVINNLVDDNTHGIADSYTKSSISKYLSGESSFKKKSKEVIKNLEITNFINFLNIHLTNDDQVNAFCSVLNDKGATINNFEPYEDITDYFVKILSNIKTKRKTKKVKEKTHKDEPTNNLHQQSLAAAALNSNPQFFLKRLNMEENEYIAAEIVLNNKLPKNICNDFKYRILRYPNDKIAPELIPKNEKAFLNHQLSFKYNFKGKEEIDKFIRTIQKANILCKFIEVNNNSVEKYIDDFKDKYYDPKRYKQYVGPTDKEMPILIMSLTLDNGRFSQHFDKLVLKEQEIKGDTIIYSNIDDGNWLYIRLSIDCSRYEEGIAKQNLNLGIKKNYATNIYYYKNFHKCVILMIDNNTHITLTDTSNNNNFIDTDITNKNNFTDEDYKGMLEMFNSYDKISKIQEITKTIFTFNPKEYNAYKPIYDIAYACVTNQNYDIKREIIVEIIVPDEKLNDYKVGDIKDRSTETDCMTLFDKKITFKNKIIKLKKAETQEVYKKDGLNIAKVKTYEVKIEEA